MYPEENLDKVLSSDVSNEEKLDAITDYCISDINFHHGTYFPKRVAFGFKLLEETDYPRGEAYMNMARAYELWREHKLREMKPFVSRSIKMFEELDDRLGLTIALTIDIFRKLAIGEFTEAFQSGIRGVRITENNNLGDSGSWIFYMMGVMYFDIEDYQNALKYYSRGLDIFETIGHDFAAGRSKAGIASCHLQLGNFDTAEQIIHDVIRHFTENYNAEGLSRAINDLGVLYLKKGDIDSAERRLTEAYQIRMDLKNKSGLNTTLLELGELYIEKGDYQKALDHLAEARELSKGNLAKPKLMRAHNLSYLACKAQADIPKAFESLERYLELYNEVANAETNNKLKMQESNFATEKAEHIAEIERQKNKEITDSINYAKRIQAAILPSTKLIAENLSNSFVLYKPKDIVAGDFYWMEAISTLENSPVEEGFEQRTILFVACDCTGHGVPGAMVSVICNNGLNRSVHEYGLRDPGKILDKTREIVISEFEKSEEDVKDGMDVALCSLKGTTLKYAGAHNPLWIIRNGSDKVDEIKANKQPIGKYDTPRPYTTHTIKLDPGDTIYIFSDGFQDQFGGSKGKKFKPANLKKLLLAIQEKSMAEQRDILDTEFEKWKGNLEQVDDVCVIGVRL